MAAGIQPRGAMPEGLNRNVYKGVLGEDLGEKADIGDAVGDFQQVPETFRAAGLDSLIKNQGSAGTQIVKDNSSLV